MDVSVMIEGQAGLTWDRWRTVAREVERLGFAGLFRSDHFVNASPGMDASLEMIVSLVWLAEHTERVRFGPLVAPVSFRDPVMLTRQAAAIADIAGDGRMILGLGAGWMTREHEMFGYDLGDVSTRSARLEEGVEVARMLLRSDGPVDHDGRFYRLRGAQIDPRPAGVPICIGGNGMRRTLPLAARYADVWNGFGLTPDALRARVERLDALLAEHGRERSALRRTLMTSLLFAADDAGLERKIANARRARGLEDAPLEDVVAALRGEGIVVGTAQTIKEQLRDLEDAGLEEIMLQWLDLDDLDGLTDLARATLPLRSER